MSAATVSRRFSALILVLWMVARTITIAHYHPSPGSAEEPRSCSCCSCCHDHEPAPADDPGVPPQPDEDEPPCGICVTQHHIPLIAFAAPETAEELGDVAAWISPWIALVPEEVFFDRPLARGPPAAS
jgi:hypothetical protein